jgi:hypothetical protein
MSSPTPFPTGPTSPTDDGSLWRKRTYHILIAVAAGLAIGRILSAELVYEPSVHRTADEPPYAGRTWPSERPLPMPTFSSNDRSRWATVRALVDEGTYVIGQRDLNPSLAGIVVGSGSGGVLPVLAGIVVTKPYRDHGIVFEDGYGTVDKILNPETKEFYSTKPPLLPTLMAGEYWVLKKAFGWSIVENRWLVVRTILLTFNALPWVLYLLLVAALVERFGFSDWGRIYVVAAGCFATLLVPFLISINNHTIAACSAVAALYFAVRAWEDAGAWAFALAGFFAAFTACNELPATAFLVGLGVVLAWRNPGRAALAFLPAALVPIAAFFGTNYAALGEWLPAYTKFGTEWYQYPGSHWLPKPDPHGIDFARFHETRYQYAFHLLLGHHGLFSLTPLYLLALSGMLMAVVGGRKPWRLWALLALALTVVVVGFYLVKSDNYGGWTAGPRWLMWLTPLWLVAMIPVADWLGRSRWGCGLALVLLAASAVSVAYSLRNPWRHPWIYTFMDDLGWIPY